MRSKSPCYRFRNAAILWVSATGLPLLATPPAETPIVASQRDPSAVGSAADDPARPATPTDSVAQSAQPMTNGTVAADWPIENRDRLTGNWFTARTKLEDHGIAFEASLTSDWSSNFQGGNNTSGSAFRHLFDANLTVDTEKLFDFPGGTFFIDFMNHNGGKRLR